MGGRWAARGWQPLIDENSNATSIRSDEERLPAHPVKALLQGAAGGSSAGGKAGVASGIAPSATDAAIASLAGATRTLFYGYVPVGNREKYVDRRPVAAAEPAQVLADYQASVQAASTLEANFDFRLDEVTTRVVSVWHGLFATDATAADKLTDTGGTERAPTVALYLILDLADWLNRYIPEVFTAIVNSQPAPAGTRQALVDELKAVKIQWQENGTGAFKDITLADAIKEIAPDLDLVRGTGDEPNDKYDIRFPVVPGGNAETYLRAELPEGAFHQKLRQALSATDSPADVSEEIVSLLKDQVTLEPPDGAATPEGTYFLRFVYEYPPCKPVLSERSEPFTFARYFDPDAPARHIRIQLPSVNMKDLRKYKRGVGLEMSPELRDIMNRVNKKMLDGEGLSGSAGGWELGMICSFSLQIIFLVAFIVMFIFLIAFNFIFWWLPFLKICFPIPVKKSA